MTALHVVLGVALVVVNLAAGLLGAWRWHRGELQPRVLAAAARRPGARRDRGRSRAACCSCSARSCRACT